MPIAFCRTVIPPVTGACQHHGGMHSRYVFIDRGTHEEIQSIGAKGSDEGIICRKAILAPPHPGSQGLIDRDGSTVMMQKPTSRITIFT